MNKTHLPKTSLLATHTSIAKKADVLEGLAEITFPKMSTQAKRPRLNLAIAIDTSGSMCALSGGMQAIEHAKIATLSLLDRLDDDDRVAIVAYSGAARVLIESMPVRNARTLAKQALVHLRAMGSTALHAGWLTAAQQAAPFAGEYDLSRVLLLSDGQATDGIKDESQLAAEAEKLCGAGLSTSTYGLGANFNERLMTGMAVGGVARYAETADVLVPYFEADFSMLAQTVARSVHLKLEARDAKTDELLEATLLGGGQLDGLRWRLAAGVAGANSWAAFSVPAKHGHDIKLSATWTLVDLAGKEQTLTTESVIKRGAGKANKAVVARLDEAKAAKAAAEAAEAARRGDREATLRHLDSFRTLAGSSVYACAVSANLDALAATGDLSALAKETTYTSNAMFNRVVDADEKHDSLTRDRFGLRKVQQGKDAQDVPVNK